MLDFPLFLIKGMRIVRFQLSGFGFRGLGFAAGKVKDVGLKDLGSRLCLELRLRI